MIHFMLLGSLKRRPCANKTYCSRQTKSETLGNDWLLWLSYPCFIVKPLAKASFVP